ncbi:hypothetical protein GCM10008090_22040 [Arenicella chitinivorans]|uniref:Uncharacterized protein n=1 Tax=Arenicella chitinivorans TaxID=1329800 RepID=A0A918RUW4_9GAMM|nr:hypothetical protein [Arenicella chitinivorans]GHA11839.1 hypothetical protein GCM10008090_22040 [Arenicella chitinivorans]
MVKHTLFFLLMVWCATALAQIPSNDSDLPASDSSADTATDTAGDAAERERELARQEEARAREAAKKRDDNYVPSEEISDDLPAPFPVDI